MSPALTTENGGPATAHSPGDPVTARHGLSGCWAVWQSGGARGGAPGESGQQLETSQYRNISEFQHKWNDRIGTH